MRVARVAGLLLRLVHGDSDDPELHRLFTEFTEVLPELSEEEQANAEALVALRLLAALGVDAGGIPPEGYGPDALTYAEAHRAELISRINRGISASGL
jgi:hypothetical protein